MESVRQPVIIMGMARSGTSLLAGMLNRMGLFLGHQKIAGDEEAKFFFRLNAIMLRRVHAEFDNPGPMRYFLDDAEAVRMTVACLAADIRSCRIIGYLGVGQYLKYGSLSGYDKPWGWKDPLNIYTLPVWLRLFPKAKIVYIVRNGVDVARSLVELHRRIVAKRQSRNQRKFRYLSLQRNIELFGFKGASRCLSLDGSFSLWEEFVAQAEETLGRIDNERIVIRYESFVTAPRAHLVELGRFCELPECAENVFDDAANRVRAERSNAFLDNSDLTAFYHRVKSSPWMQHYGYRHDPESSPTAASSGDPRRAVRE
jgi:hypothetical protein